MGTILHLSVAFVGFPSFSSFSLSQIPTPVHCNHFSNKQSVCKPSSQILHLGGTQVNTPNLLKNVDFLSAGLRELYTIVLFFTDT